MPQSFSAQIGAWALKVDGAIEAVFKESVQELVEQADQLLTQMVYEAPPAPSGYKRTGFLRSSVKVSTASMPLANRPQGVPDTGYMAEIEVQIAGAELGETIYIGWTANYAGYVHYGSNGLPPKPWVSLVAQRWQQIVDAKAGELKSRLGL
jgi:hypothetical protein